MGPAVRPRRRWVGPRRSPVAGTLLPTVLLHRPHGRPPPGTSATPDPGRPAFDHGGPRSLGPAGRRPPTGALGPRRRVCPRRPRRPGAPLPPRPPPAAGDGWDLAPTSVPPFDYPKQGILYVAAPPAPARPPRVCPTAAGEELIKTRDPAPPWRPGRPGRWACSSSRRAATPGGPSCCAPPRTDLPILPARGEGGAPPCLVRKFRQEPAPACLFRRHVPCGREFERPGRRACQLVVHRPVVPLPPGRTSHWRAASLGGGRRRLVARWVRPR